MSKLNLACLQQFYKGFNIDTPVGNNAFSFQKRKKKEIFVPPLIQADLKSLVEGDTIAFREYFDGKDINKTGLRNFLYLDDERRDIFVFDNHNHAFFFWIAGAILGRFPLGLPLVHVDQHRDMRVPDRLLKAEEFSVFGDSIPSDLSIQNDLRKVFEYTNFELNVGNFIPPALELKIFSQVEMITTQDSFNQPLPKSFVLDIDMDIFAPELDYIPYAHKVSGIKEMVKQSQFVTIATSPYFIDQSKAIEIIKELLNH